MVENVKNRFAWQTFDLDYVNDEDESISERQALELALEKARADVDEDTIEENES